MKYRNTGVLLLIFGVNFLASGWVEDSSWLRFVGAIFLGCFVICIGDKEETTE